MHVAENAVTPRKDRTRAVRTDGASTGNFAHRSLGQGGGGQHVDQPGAHLPHRSDEVAHHRPVVVGLPGGQRTATGLIGEPVPPEMRSGAAVNRNSQRPARSQAAQRSSNCR